MADNSSMQIQPSKMDEILISNIQGGVITCKFDPKIGKSRTVYISEGWTQLTGYTLEELNEKFDSNPQALICKEDVERTNKDYVEQTSKSNRYRLEYRFYHKNGHLVWALDSGIITSEKNGVNMNQSIITDITKIKLNEEKLRVSEDRFRIATKASNATVFEFDIKENRYIYIENAEVVFNTDGQSVISRVDLAKNEKENFDHNDVLSIIYHPDDMQKMIDANAQMYKNPKAMSESEVRICQPDGGYLWCNVHKAVVCDAGGVPIRIIGHLVDVDVHHRKTEQLIKEAQSDPLTGLYNKTLSRVLVEEKLAAMPDKTHVMMVLDIDNFKGVNDSLGHLFGDYVLMEISNKLKRLFTKGEFVGRVGGDEFVVFLPEIASEYNVVEKTEKICKVFRNTYSGEKADYKISGSVGIVFSLQGDTYDTLFKKADIALYQAKASGKDKYVIYDEQKINTPMLCKKYTHQTDITDSGNLKLKERIFEVMYDSVDFASSINMLLSLIGQILDVDRIYIFENTKDDQLAHNIYEWCAEGVTSDPFSKKPILIGELDYFSQFNWQGIYSCPNTKILEEPFCSLYNECGITSTFQVLIREQGAIRGFMGFENIASPINATAEMVDIMVFATKVIGTFIIKKRADESVQLFNRNKMQALDNLGAAIYVIDENYRLQYINNMVTNICPDTVLGDKCHKKFMQNDSPCLECPAKECKYEQVNAEIYNHNTDMWLSVNAANIEWSGRKNMRLLCCQVIDKYKKK